MSKPKAAQESADAKAARLAEEERIRVAQARADAQESAAGRQLLTRKTRMTMRLFGARSAMSGFGGSGSVPILGGNSPGGIGIGVAGGGGGIGLSNVGSNAFTSGGGSVTPGAFLGGGWAR